MAEKGIVEYRARDGQHIKLSPTIIKNFLVSGRPEFVTDQELYMYIGVCKSRGLNPFIKDAYLIKYTPKDPAAIIVSIDYYRKRARAQKDCRGWKSGIVLLDDQRQIIYREGCILLDGEVLIGGWYEAQPDGWDIPMRKEVNLNRYIKKTREGKTTRFWSEENQPEQIAKIAESQGLRSTWPDEFQGLYVDSEVQSKDAQDDLDQQVYAAAAESQAEPAHKEKSDKEKIRDKIDEIKNKNLDKPVNGDIVNDDKPNDTEADEWIPPLDRDKVMKRYSEPKRQTLMDLLNAASIPFNENMTGAELHNTYIDGMESRALKKAKAEADKPIEAFKIDEPGVSNNGKYGAMMSEADKDMGKASDEPKTVEDLEDKYVDSQTGFVKNKPYVETEAEQAAKRTSTATIFHDLEELSAMPLGLQRVYLTLADENNCATEEVSPKAVTMRLKTEAPELWEEARNELGFSRIPVTNDAADTWNRLVIEKLTEQKADN